MTLSKKMLAILLSALLCVPFSGISAFAEVSKSPDTLEETSDIDTKVEEGQEEDSEGSSDVGKDSSDTQNQNQNQSQSQNQDQDQIQNDSNSLEENEGNGEDSSEEGLIADHVESVASETTKMDAAEVIEYVYLDEPLVTLGQEQYIAVGLLDVDARTETAKLTLLNVDTEEFIEIEAAEFLENSALFSCVFENDSEIAAYQIVGLSYSLEETEGDVFVDFSTDTEEGNSYTFNVITQHDNDVLEALQESEGEAVLAVKEDGETVITDSLGEALGVVDEEGVADSSTNDGASEGDFSGDEETLYEDEVFLDDEGQGQFDQEVYVKDIDVEIPDSLVDYRLLLLDETLYGTSGIMEEEFGSEEEVKEEKSVLDIIAGFFISVFTPEKAYAATGNKVVALDPGHGGTDSGATGNGLLEKDLNLKIAKYCAAELKLYSGVTTYMTRTTDTYVGTAQRVKNAVKNGANVFVSLHINSSNGKGFGAEVWVPNTSSYNYSTRTEGAALGNKIVGQLAKLGLANRDTKIRNSKTETKYSNGSLADHYTVIYESRKAGIAGVIVEHAFIDNASDAALLKQESFLKKCGVADATGIAQTYGLSKGKIQYQAHVQSIGWQSTVADGASAGTSGQSKRIEAIKISLGNVTESGSVLYSAHVQGIGWQNYKSNGAMAGTSGQSKRLEGIKIKLSGNVASTYDIYYRTHNQAYGWSGWAKNGAACGTQGYGKRMEAVQIRLVKKGAAAPGSTSNAFRQKSATNLKYQAYVNKDGWQSAVMGGSTAGTTGKSLSIEGLKVSIANRVYNGSVQYNAHVQGIGWQGWKSNGSLAGTTGKSKRLEAIQVKLTGEMAERYDVYYRVHSQSYGWLGWAKNGASAGTSGYGKRVEAIQIKLVAKGGKAPGSTSNVFVQKQTTPTTTKTAIMGTSKVSVDQMVKMYTAQNKVFPTKVYEQYGAKDIKTFCTILKAEAEDEGVRADVVFIQAMVETGWLQFGGDVKASQCNFCGLGATGNGNPGNSFIDTDKKANSVKKGLRAQVQHLKAYASTAALKNTCVDPRFTYVTRGCAPYVEDLGGKWATLTTYGTDIVALMKKLATY